MATDTLEAPKVEKPKPAARKPATGPRLLPGADVWYWEERTGMPLTAIPAKLIRPPTSATNGRWDVIIFPGGVGAPIRSRSVAFADAPQAGKLTLVDESFLDDRYKV